MTKKIVITGGLGYIGTELCKIYSGVSWNNQILVIDNRFVSERVNQLRSWNIDFIHGDILDKNLIDKYCKDADIVHHLAGITDVPRVKSESSDDQDSKIKLVAEEGTQNILNAISNKCKIIFPSTHVIFEGEKILRNNILVTKHDHLVFNFTNNYKLVFNDPRKFGFIDIVKSDKIKNIRYIKKLGLDALDKNLSIDYLYKKIYKIRKVEKKILIYISYQAQVPL